MATEIEAAELLTLQACDLKNRGEPVTKVAAMAKYYASEVAVKVSTDAVQIFGGYGYTKDFPVEKYYRDTKLCTIGEGTSRNSKDSDFKRSVEVEIDQLFQNPILIKKHFYNESAFSILCRFAIVAQAALFRI